MGIRGLMKYCLDTRNNCVEQLDLIQIARERGEIELLVDFYSFEHLLLRKFWAGLSTLRNNPFLRILGGDYTSLNLFISKFISELKSFGISLIFFIDGSKGSCRNTTRQKLDTWVKRHHDDMKQFNDLLDVCRGTKDIADIPDTVSVRPVLLEIQFLHALKQLNCEIIQCSEGEADYKIAHGLSNRPNAFCVLSNDSDFCVFKNCCFVPNDLFDSENDLHLGEPVPLPEKPKKLMVGMITTERVMGALNLHQQSYLIELSIVSGNDFTSSFMTNFKTNLDIKGPMNVWNLAGWVRHYKSIENHGLLSSEMQYDRNFRAAVQHSRDFYNLTLNKQQENSNRGYMTNIIHERVESGAYPANFMGMHRKFYWHRMLLEDTVYGQPCIEGVLSGLRSYVYRMLLPRNEMVVTDYGKSPWEPFASVATQVSDDRQLPGVQFIQVNQVFKNLRTFHHIMTHIDPDVEKPWFDKYGRKNGFMIYILRYFLLLNWGHNLYISDGEFIALIAMAFSRPGKNEGFYQEMTIRPTPRCVTIANWYQDIYRHAYSFLGSILNLKHEFPTPDEIFSGSAWTAYYTCCKDEAWEYATQYCQIPLERLHHTRSEMNKVIKEKRHIIKNIVEGFFPFGDNW